MRTRTPATTPSWITRSVASANITRRNEAKRAAARTRKLRKFHCGTNAMNGACTGRCETSAIASIRPPTMACRWRTFW